MTTNTKVVTFGKYNGKNVDTLISDSKYCEWLTAQPWFVEKYRDIYNVIINYNGEPQDTPEHNILQARFLDHEFCLKLGNAACCIDKQYLEETWEVERRNKALIRKNEPIYVHKVIFEEKGWDVIIHYRGGMELNDGGCTWIYAYNEICVECKPIVGDDYPSILRQMRKYPVSMGAFKVLLINQFRASGATLFQVKQIFTSAGIKIVMLSDIDQRCAP